MSRHWRHFLQWYIDSDLENWTIIFMSHIVMVRRFLWPMFLCFCSLVSGEFYTGFVKILKRYEYLICGPCIYQASLAFVWPYCFTFFFVFFSFFFIFFCQCFPTWGSARVLPTGLWIFLNAAFHFQRLLDDDYWSPKGKKRLRKAVPSHYFEKKMKMKWKNDENFEYLDSNVILSLCIFLLCPTGSRIRVKYFTQLILDPFMDTCLFYNPKS